MAANNGTKARTHNTPMWCGLHAGDEAPDKIGFSLNKAGRLQAQMISREHNRAWESLDYERIIGSIAATLRVSRVFRGPPFELAMRNRRFFREALGESIAHEDAGVAPPGLKSHQEPMKDAADKVRHSAATFQVSQAPRAASCSLGAMTLKLSPSSTLSRTESRRLTKQADDGDDNVKASIKLG